jgi:flavin-dependent dehydrogenase
VTVESYDVVVVGARAGGAATAMLLARRGLRVLLLDRDRYGTDTISTHALMRGGVLLLTRWGILDRVIDAGTPAVRRTQFHYGSDGTCAGDSVTVTIKPTFGVEALYGPRRTLLDAILIDAAAAAGAEVRFGVSVTGLLCDDSDSVVGVVGRDRAGRHVSARGRLTVGADGVRSTVAREAGARTLRIGTGAGAIVYGYWSGLAVEGYEWFYRPGHTAGFIPTNGGEVCVFAGVPAEVLANSTDGRLSEVYRRLLDEAIGGAAKRLAAADPPRRLRTWVGRPSMIREAHGRGWALVGDAGSFLDPLSTHGITDALRDADALARTVVETGTVGPSGLERFAAARDKVVGSLFDHVDRIAGYGWSMPEVRRHLTELSSAMSDEVEMIAAGSTDLRVPS